MLTMSWPTAQIEERFRTEQKVWVRAAAARDLQGAWNLQFLEVTAGAPPPSWRPARWEYRDALLVSSEHPGADIAGWLSDKHVPLGDHRLDIQPMTQAQVHRVDSLAKSGFYETLPWPCISVDFAASSDGQIPDGSLVADDAPTFYEFGMAAAAFFGVPAALGRAARAAQAVFRVQDLTGRILLARISASELAVSVEGARLAGAAVDLARPDGSERRRLGDARAATVVFPLTEPLPQGTWVVLHRDGEWVDRRFLNWPYSMGTEPGVEVVVEPEARLEALVSAGEGPSTEFKATLPPRPQDRAGIRKALKTVAAFANAEGGTILFGVTDDGAVVGVERERGIEERLSNLVQSWVSPLPPYHVEVLPLEDRDDRAIYAVIVDQGDRPPYGCGTEPSELVYCVRRGATTFPIDADEVRALARSRPPEGEGIPGRMFD